MIPSVYLPIGWSSSDASRRRVNYSIETPGGWSKYVREYARPLIDGGVTTIEIHNPGGVGISDGFMRFDQFSLAKKEGLDFVNDFVEAWHPLKAEGIRVIGYVGSPDDIPALFDTTGDIDRDPDLDDDDARIKSNPYAMGDLKDQALEELKPFSDAGADFAFDRTSEKGVDSLSWWLCNREKSQGKNPIIEIAPERDATHWHDTETLILYRTFLPRHMEGTSPTWIERYYQLGEGEWYKARMHILFRSTVTFNSGARAGERVQLWRDASPMVEWWNEIRSRDSVNDIYPMVGKSVFEALVKQNLLSELAD